MRHTEEVVNQTFWRRRKLDVIKTTEIRRLQDVVNPTSGESQTLWQYLFRSQDVVTFLRRPEDVLKTSVSAGKHISLFGQIAHWLKRVTVGTRLWAQIPLRPTLSLWNYKNLSSKWISYLNIYIYSLISFKWYEQPKKVFPTLFSWIFFVKTK